jgi:UDP-glucuronate decarboxylase
MHDKPTLVTGGAGFIGSHLCDALLARGDEVLCVDNFFTGSKDNLENALRNRRFEIIRHDVTLSAPCRGKFHLQPRLPGLATPLPA